MAPALAAGGRRLYRPAAMRYLSFPAFLAVSMALGACSNRGGEWPSLARVPGSPNTPCGAAVESAPPAARPCVAAPPAGAIAPAQSETAAPAPDLSALEARLAAARSAWTDQLKTAESAVSSAARADSGESAWAAAELQLSRLEGAAVPFEEIADALAGSESGTTLRLSAQADRQRHLDAFARLRSALRR
ncbi:hypothetical protein [Sphingosinicella soli]|uniref:Uncharacterized protein n=1 Tax=Sphingosinicella soli TaxID=333708 RepID=A0A7W7F7F5_9SPHN|nr:hypothetical protein [Sphingosinicella soli]MBB4633620.1 hypothetical protein [Sphingosinicella soli]